MKTLIKIAFRNVVLHWRQSLAAIVSLAAGLVSLVMFQGYMKDVAHMYQESFRSRMMYGDIIIEHKKMMEAEGRAEPWNFSMHPADQQFIFDFLKKHEEDIDSVAQFLRISGTITNGKSTTIFQGRGSSVESAKKMRGADWAWNTLYGSPLQANAPNELVLGQSLGKILGCRPDRKEKVMDAVAGYKAEVRPFTCLSDEVQLSVTTATGQLNAIDLKVVGLVDALYKDVDDKFMMTSLESAQMLMNTQDLSYISVKLQGSFLKTESILRELNQEFKKAGMEIHAIRWEDHQVGEMYVRTMSLLSIFRNFVVTIILAIAMLAIFNTMMKLVKERTREIGTLRSIGFIPRQVLIIFVIESVILSLLGGVIGSISAVLGTVGMNALGIVYKAGVLVEPVPFRIMISPSLYVISFIILSILAALTTLFVCRSTLNVETVENLTHS